MKRNLSLLLLLLFSVATFSQVNKDRKVSDSQKAEKASLILQPKRFFVSKPVRDLPPSGDRSKLEGKIVPKDGITTTVGMSAKRLRKLNYLKSAGESPTAVDPIAKDGFQLLHETPTRAPLEAFEAIGLDVSPPDPSMAVGPNHIVTMENGQWAVYDKQGNIASGFPRALTDPLQAPGSTANSGDPVVMYDRQADRWFISQFQLPGDNVFLIGVSTTPDPTGAYNVYEYELTTGNDYPHYAVWGDSYVTAGNFTGAQKVYTFNRQKMLDGDATAEIVGFSPSNLASGGFTAPIPVHSEGAGEATGPIKIVYYQDDAFGGVAIGNDHIGMWTLDMDWTNATTIANSTISGKTEIPTTAFDAIINGGTGFANLAQPGTTQRIDAIVGAVMNMSHWYKFPSHESILLNWVVEVTDGSQISGIRWVELRSLDNGATWSVYQEGTFTDPTGNESVFMGCMSMDIQGNIGLGYTKTGVNTFPSLYYTGRKVGDALGTMTVAEDLAFAGTSSVTGNDRYGDYGQGVRDPIDDLTFWVTSEFSGDDAALGGRRVGVYSFKIFSEYELDAGVIAVSQPISGDALSATENISITIQNFGDTTISNIPVEYSVNGGTPITGIVPGPLDLLETVTFTFPVTADLSTEGPYEICARTLLVGDEVSLNDQFCKFAVHFNCLPGATTTGCNLDGIKRLVLGTIDADDGGNGCNTEPDSGPLGYSDRTDLSTELDRSAGNNSYTLQAQSNYNPADFGATDFDVFSMWIDFNDNGEFEVSEQLINGVPFTVAAALSDFPFTVPVAANGGSHIMRCKSFDPGAAGSATDPCGTVAFGEVQDYTVTIIDTTLDCPSTTTYTAGTWSNGAPDNTTAAIIASNYDAAASGGMITCDLIVNAGITLDMDVDTFTVYGDITNNGTITGEDATLILTGTSPKVFGGATTAATTFGTLEIDNASGVTINSAVDVKRLLTLSSGTLTTNGLLTFKSDATGTGELDILPTSGATISGEVTVERFVPAKRAFRFLTSAVTTTTSINANWQEGGTSATDDPNPGFGTHITGSTTGANGFDTTGSGNPSMFTFDAALQTFNAIPNTDTDVLNVGNPYLILIRGNRSTDITMNDATPSDAILRATGTLQLGDVIQTGFSSIAGEFNFIGNPYQSSIDIVDILANSVNINTSQYYIWDPNLGARGQYVTLLLPGGANTSSSDGNRYLQVGQGAFVTTLAAGTASAFFEETDKTPGIETTTFFNEENPIADNAHIIGKLFQTETFNMGGSLQDSFGILFSDQFTNDLTPADAVKPTNIDENMGISNGESTLSLERRALPQQEDVIQLYNSTYRVSDYTLKLNITGLPNITAYLVDAFNGIATELSDGENLISFAVNEGDESSAEDRFRIVFADPTLTLEDTASFDLELFPIPLDGDALSITSTELIGQTIEAKVINLLGQQLFSEKLLFTETTTQLHGFDVLSAGLYFVTITSEEGSITKRVVKK